jgi:FtsZ-binding cell division protein ZapB
MTAVKHSYEDEVRLLDTEVAELRAKQRQSTSYIQELQKRFEETVRSVYR